MERQGSVGSPREAERYVAALLEPGSNRHPWAVVLQDRLVGLVCVNADAANRSGWFWYWMASETRGRGWTSRAAAAVANWALTALELERLELGHRVDNPASGGVARAAGFIREGTERAKFPIDGRRIDVATYGRSATDPGRALPDWPSARKHERRWLEGGRPGVFQRRYDPLDVSVERSSGRTGRRSSIPATIPPRRGKSCTTSRGASGSRSWRW